MVLTKDPNHVKKHPISVTREFPEQTETIELSVNGGDMLYQYEIIDIKLYLYNGKKKKKVTKKKRRVGGTEYISSRESQMSNSRPKEQEWTEKDTQSRI